MAKYDRKALLNILNKLEECSGAKNFNYKIDDDIVAVLPDWIKKRVRDRLYKPCKRDGASNPETILNFCQLTIVSIQPFTEGEVICLIGRKGDIVKIRFTLRRSEN